MISDSMSPFDRYALIALIAERLGGPGQKLGKKALQKTVHLIEELAGGATGYRFSFHTYGPYSHDLEGDLGNAARFGGVVMTYNEANYYLIAPGPKTGEMIAHGRAFLERNRRAIDRVIRTFGGRTAKGLELVSTIVFLRAHDRPETFADDAKLVARVKGLKPTYSEPEIRAAIGEVRDFLASERQAA
jgi:uncharacterized protein YwgA